MKEPMRSEIKGVVYEFYHISPRKLNKILIKLVKLGGDKLASLIGSIADEQPEGKAETFTTDTIKNVSKKIKVKDVVELLVSCADEVVLDDIIKELLSATTKTGFGQVSKNLDTAFDSIGEMYEVIFAAGKAYFGDFLTGVSE